jgi:hypothetical protein
VQDARDLSSDRDTTSWQSQHHYVILIAVLDETVRQQASGLNAVTEWL